MNKMKRIFFILFAFTFMFSISLFITKDTYAAQKAPKFEHQNISTFLTNPQHSFVYSLGFKNLDASAKITAVRSSNKKVLTVQYTSGADYIKYLPKKAGKAVISCTVKQNGKTYNLKKTIKVLKGSPFKNVKINGKQVYQKGNNLVYFYSTQKDVKISFKLKSGWTLKRMYYNYHDKKMSKNFKMTNGDTIKIKGKGKAKYTSVKIDVKNKDGEVFRYLICLYNQAKPADYFYAPAERNTVFLEGNE